MKLFALAAVAVALAAAPAAALSTSVCDVTGMTYMTAEPRLEVRFGGWTGRGGRVRTRSG